MKRWWPLWFLSCLAIVCCAEFTDRLKAHSEQKQEQRQQELQEYIDKSMNECSWAYPLDLISRAKCYERLLG